MENAVRAFSARFAHSEELRCEARKKDVSGSLDEVSQSQHSSMGIFYCQQHGLYHGYSFHKFRLLVVKERDAYLAQHRDALVAEIGSGATTRLIECHNSAINQIFRADHASYTEHHLRLLGQERSDRVISAIKDLGFTPEQADEFYACYRKQAHPSPAHARQHIVALTQSLDFNGGELQSYQCSYCTGWHIGHLRAGDGERDVVNRREKALAYLRKGRGEVESFYAEKGITRTPAIALNRGGADE